MSDDWCVTERRGYDTRDDPPVKALPVLSLVLCATVCGMRVRSHTIWDAVSFALPDRGTDEAHVLRIIVSSLTGEIVINWGSITMRRASLPDVFGSDAIPVAPGTFQLQYTSGGFVHTNRATAFNLNFEIAIPHWFLAMILALPPAIWLIQFLRTRKRRQPGMCSGCGYDLRATPDRFPECGAVPVKIAGVS